MAKQKVSLSYRLLQLIFRLLARALMRLDIKGMERTPLEGPLLITVNHTTVIEAPLIMAFSPRQPLSAFAKQEYRGTLAGKIVDIVNPVYVARGEVDRQALKEMLRRLKEGAAFGIAPEGTRSKTGKLMEAKEGTSYLALQTDAWILPAAIWGHETLFSDLKRFRRPRVYIRIGEPFKLERDPNRERRENMELATRRIMHAIARLLPPEYRGVYADEVQGDPVWLEEEKQLAR